MRGIARSIANYPPGSPNDVLQTLNDVGNAERFVRQWGDDLRYVPELGKWIVWNGTYWEVDRADAVVEALTFDDAFDVSVAHQARWDKANLGEISGTYGTWLSAKVGKVFPVLASEVLI